MIDIVGRIPREVTVACSGGPDSMAVLDFLRRGHEVTAAYFNHGTSHGMLAQELVEEYCDANGVPLVVGMIERARDPKMSLEEFWRNERYGFFAQLGEVVTGHNLGDVVEWWLMSSVHGEAKLIPYRNQNVFRPFMATPKKEFVSWCERKSVPFLVDPGNASHKYARSLMRTKVVPLMKVINPGIEKVLKKKLLMRDRIT